MNELTKYAIGVLFGSIVALAWGFQYRSAHSMAAVGSFFGHTDATYSLAGWAAGLGILGFIIGIAMLIGGLLQHKSPGPTND